MTQNDHVSPLKSQGASPRVEASWGGIGALYSAQKRKRQGGSDWTAVRGVRGPIQYVVFSVSLCLVVRTLLTGEGAWAADISIILQTLILCTIVGTGLVRKKVVSGEWLFAPECSWDVAFSILVLALHTAYLVMLFGGIVFLEARMGVALAGYAAYAVNAAPLRMVRLEAAKAASWASGAVPA